MGVHQLFKHKPLWSHRIISFGINVSVEVSSIPPMTQISGKAICHYFPSFEACTGGLINVKYSVHCYGLSKDMLGVDSGFVRPKSCTIRGSSFNTKNAGLDTKTWSSHKAQASVSFIKKDK